MRHRRSIPVLVFAAAVLTFAGCHNGAPSAGGGMKWSAPADPTAREEAYRTWLGQRLDRVNSERIHVQVSFARWLSIEELNRVLASSTIEIERIHVVLPNIDNGTRATFGIRPPATRIADMNSLLVQDAERWAGFPDLAAQLRTEATRPNPAVQIYGLRGVGSSRAIRAWWSRNTDVRFVQFIEQQWEEIDEIQRLFEPGERVR